MPLTENTYLKQVELFIGQDAQGAVHVFAERVNEVVKDGAVIASSNHRDSFAADSDEGQAILGEALSAALSAAQQAITERDQLAARIAELEAQLAATVPVE